MTHLDDLFADSRESRDWDLPTESGLAATAIRRGRRRRTWQAVGAGLAASLVAITAVVWSASPRSDSPTTASSSSSLIAQLRAEVLAQKGAALEAWESAGADAGAPILPGLHDAPAVRPEQQWAIQSLSGTDAAATSLTVQFNGTAADGVCAWDYEALAVEAAHGVVVTLFGRPHEVFAAGAEPTCPEIAFQRETTVALKAPLGGRAVFDGQSGRHLPDGTYAPTFPEVPSFAATASAAIACSAGDHGTAPASAPASASASASAGNTVVTFGCADGVGLVYLVRTTHSAAFSVAWVSEVLQLMAGLPTSKERAAGVEPAIPPEFALAANTIVGTTLTIDLPPGFDKRSGNPGSATNSINILKALVSTLQTAKAPFKTLRITIGGSCATWATMRAAEPGRCTYPLS